MCFQREHSKRKCAHTQRLYACILLFSWEPLNVWNINTLLELSKISNSNTEHKTVQLKWIIVLHSRSGNYSCIDSISVYLEILRKHAFLYDCSLFVFSSSSFFLFIIYRSLLICVCAFPQRFWFRLIACPGTVTMPYQWIYRTESIFNFWKMKQIFEASIYVRTHLNEFTTVN